MMFAARVQLSPNPSLVLARSRRSGCFPAEPYPPLRSLEVYPERAMICNYGTKKRLTFAALSDMCINWQLRVRPAEGYACEIVDHSIPKRARYFRSLSASF